MFFAAWNAASFSVLQLIAQPVTSQPMKVQLMKAAAAPAYPAPLRSSPATQTLKGWVMPETESALYQPPLDFATEVLKVDLWDKQKEVLAALPDYQRVAVKSGNGLGKGFSAAVAVLWFLSCHEPAIVLSTATETAGARIFSSV